MLVLHRGAVTVSSTGAENQFQVDDNGHVGRPCEVTVSLAPPYPELFASYGAAASAVTRHGTSAEWRKSQHTNLLCWAEFVRSVGMAGLCGMLRSCCYSKTTAALLLAVLLLQQDRACARGRAARRDADPPPAAGCDQNGFDAAMAKAVRLVRSQDHRGALPCLEAAHAERQDNLMAALYLGEALLRTRSLARAASVLQHVLALDARSLMARLLLATVRQQAGQKLEAAEEFTRALDIDPANVAALVNSGTTLRELGKETEALARFESAVRVSPSTPGTNSSRMYSDLG